MKIHSAVLGLLFTTAVLSVKAFVPSPRRLTRRQQLRVLEKVDSSIGGAGEATKETEKLLRKEIEERNSILGENDEEKYALADGGVWTDIVENEPDVSSWPADKVSLEERIERILQSRAYPLFLAEKAAEIAEGIVDDLTKAKENGYPKSGKKEKVVVLGTGWGAAAYLKDINCNLYDVTVISPRNYFLFTPMLAGASVGTVEYRSITEPVREINRKVDYLEGTVIEIDPKGKTVTAESVVCDGNSCDIEDFVVEYDRLVVTIGAQTNTFGIPGVREYCNFLKQVDDARRIRTAIVNCFERANFPGMSEEERINNLTFAVIGAGPTGIEFAAELRDFVEQDGPKYYPKLLKYVRIKVIEASSTVLAPFDKSLQDEAITQMQRQVQIKDEEVRRLLPDRFELVELMLDSSVKEVTEKIISLNNGNDLPYGLAVWAAGNGPLPLTLEIIDKLGEGQSKHQDLARGRIATDAWMRADGSDGSIIAYGDCSVIVKGPDGQLPATAQVAAQQGEYLAKLMNKKIELNTEKLPDGTLLPPTYDPEGGKRVSDSIASFACNSKEFVKPFQFLNLGILAYTGGNSALAQVSVAPNSKPIKGKGKLGNALWRSVYLSKQVSVRNRVLVLNDWIKRQAFGRDITRV